MPVSLLKTWLVVSRTRLFVAVTIPAILAGSVAGSKGSFSPGSFALIVIGLVLVESSNLFSSEWAGRRKSGTSKIIEPPPLIEGSPVISEKILPPRYTLHAALLCLSSAALVLIYFAFMRGWFVLFLGLLAVTIGLFYTFSPVKYGFFSTAFLPPLLSFSVNFVLSGRMTSESFLAGLPLAFSSAGVIYSYRVLYGKRKDNFLSKSVGMELLYALAYVSLFMLILARILPATTLISFLTVPVFALILCRVRKEKTDYIPVTSLGVLLHAMIGLLISIGFLL